MVVPGIQWHILIRRCGNWLIFVAIFGMRAKNRSGKREFQLQAGAGFRVFKGPGCGYRKGKSSGIRNFNFYATKTMMWMRSF